MQNTRYVFYQDGMMSVLTPLADLKPVVTIPFLEEKQNKRLEVEITLPKKDIDPETVLLLDSQTGKLIPLEKQTNSIQKEFPQIKFYFRLHPSHLTYAYVFYIDQNPQLKWCAKYKVRLGNSLIHPNEAEIASFTCYLQVTNESDRKIGPGQFSVMIQQGRERTSSMRYRRMRMAHAEAKMAKMALPTAGAPEALAYMAPVARAAPRGPMPALEEMEEESTNVGSQVAEGFLIEIPESDLSFDKFMTTQIKIVQLNNMPVKKVHEVTLTGSIRGFATVRFLFRLPKDKGTSIYPLLPSGDLDLMSETYEYLIPPGTRRLPSLVAGNQMELLSYQDERVPIQGDVSVEQFEVDESGNKVIVYSGGLVIKNYYPETKGSDLSMELYIPVQKSLVEVKKARGIARWEYEPQKSRIKCLLEPIPPQDKTFVSFIFYNRDPIQIKNPHRLGIHFTKEMKQRLLNSLLQ